MKSSKEKEPKEVKKKASPKPAKKAVKAKQVEASVEAGNGVYQATPSAPSAEPSFNGAAAPDVIVIIESVEEEYEPPRELIEARAYEIFVERGYVDGHHVEDWLTAERELKSKQRST